MTRKQQGYIYLTLAMTTVGSTVIASKLISAGLLPFTATALRFAVAFPFFALLMRLTGARLPRLSRHDWIILVIQAAAGSFGYTTLLISGLSMTSAANAGVIIGTLPVVSAGISILLLRERPDRFLLLAIGLAAAVDYVEAIGIDAIHAHECALVGSLREQLARKNSITLFGPENSAGIVSFAMAGVHPHDIGTILDESGVAIRAGHHCAQPLMEHLGVAATARASFGVYNNDDDVAALIDGLARVERIFG